MQEEFNIKKLRSNHYLCYYDNQNMFTIAMNMMSLAHRNIMNTEVIKEITKGEDSFLLNAFNKSNLSQDEINFVFEGIFDKVRLISGFENFLKADLLANAFIIHKLDKNVPELKSLAKEQYKRPISLKEVLELMDWRLDTEDDKYKIKGIGKYTLSISTILSSGYQEILKLPVELKNHLLKLNNERNHLHFFAAAENEFGKGIFEMYKSIREFANNTIVDKNNGIVDLLNGPDRYKISKK